MEWLLSHPDDDMEETLEKSVKESTTPSGESEQTTESSEATAAGSSSTEQPVKPEEAKSLRCDDCGRLFKSQMEVEFHAAKSGHSNFR